MLETMQVGLLIVGNQSDSNAADYIQNSFQEHQINLETIPDEASQIRRVLRLWADVQNLNLILTLGGTGLGRRDNVPTITTEILERPMNGLVELMRLVGVQKTRSAALWRLEAGQRNKSIILNLPNDHLDIALPAVQPVLIRAAEEIQKGLLSQSLF